MSHLVDLKLIGGKACPGVVDKSSTLDELCYMHAQVFGSGYANIVILMECPTII